MKHFMNPFSSRLRAIAALSLCVMTLTFQTLPLTVLKASAEGLASFQQPLQGNIEKTEQANPSINPNDVKEVKKGTPIEMTVSTVLDTGVSTQGDEFFAKVTQDYMVDGKVVIPRDTIVHGLVQETAAPKFAGRNGYISTKFDYMITPDGREIPINGAYSNRDPKAMAAAKVVARSTGFTLAGGVVGALMVVKYAGLGAVIASHGYALAGGAAVGGAVGLTASLLTKGKNALIQPGADIRVRLQQDLKLPTMNVPDVSANNKTLDGLKVSVLGMRVDKDPFGEPSEMTLTLDIKNQTANDFSFFDIALEDEHGATFYASPFGDTGLWFQKLGPNSHVHGNISFSVDNTKLQHYLVFYKQYTREPVAKIALTDAMKASKSENRKRADASTASLKTE